MTKAPSIGSAARARSVGKAAVAAALSAAIAVTCGAAALTGCGSQDAGENGEKTEQAETAWQQATEGSSCIARVEDKKTHDAYNYPLITDTDAHIGPAAQFAVTWSDGRACIDLGNGSQAWQGESAETKRYSITWHTVDEYTELGGLKVNQVADGSDGDDGDSGDAEVDSGN